MTDITRLLASLKRRSAHAKEFGDSITFVKLKDIDALVEALEKAQTINAAAEKLVRCKGRYHSEQNYRALAALFGVTTPDLPPLDSESRTVTVKLPADRVAESEVSGYDGTEFYSAGWNARGKADKEALTAQGIKWEAE